MARTSDDQASTFASTPAPTAAQIKRWRRYLADERAEAAVYRELARKRSGQEREILLKLAAAEERHEKYWHDKLGNEVGMPLPPSLSTKILGWMARNIGSVFVLALMQNAESRNPYNTDADAPDQIAADENVHAEVVRGLAIRGREKMAGDFRAAVFGANDGLVSNLALIIGVMGSGIAAEAIVLTGIAGLLAGALSMAAGEYISVRSQQELLEASNPHPEANDFLAELDVNANELTLVFRARGLSEEEANIKASQVLDKIADSDEWVSDATREEEDNGSPFSAALSSFLCFSVGAFIPLLPFLFGLNPIHGGIIALVLVAISLLFTGGMTGILSGKPPLLRALRQLAVGLGAAAITYGLGAAFGTVLA
ncbi:VIT1/CCC1 transporter family protein [Corynebacterium caspium]|uniref:VIT1/CCC1 transporter family protein n=1 Tax=Corynebacterium caspium TaxID=234828 RepID=UPI0003620979|nr:VIT1/CCC1 transporter family protein [Corynebacterium caspium]WKD58901.1 VIT family protein [Corynebacterium caspium DSM 44850]